MAPTEILATQHYHSLHALLEPAHITCALLTGSVKAAEKKKIYKAPQRRAHPAGHWHPRLISDRWEFQNLGLVITDEQHRFGVGQRSAFWPRRGLSPPAGDERHPHPPHPGLDGLRRPGYLRAGRELPPGRQKIETYLIDPAKRARAFGYVQRHLDAGRQGYLICP